MSSDYMAEVVDFSDYSVSDFAAYPAKYPACLDVGDLAPKPRFRADGAAEIPLTQGFFAIVDPEDAERIFRQRWCATVTKSEHVYAMRRAKGADGKRHAIMMHREIMDAPAGFDIDHINGDTLDNRRLNLRVATRSQNGANRHREIASASRYRGVSPNHRGGRWRASITYKGRRVLLGSFSTQEAAAQAYNVAAREYFGEFASLNDIPTLRGAFR